MKLVIQRVNHAAVRVDGQITGQIGKGLFVLIGVGREDTHAIADRFLKNFWDCGFSRMKKERPIYLLKMYRENFCWCLSSLYTQIVKKETVPALSKQGIPDRQKNCTNI